MSTDPGSLRVEPITIQETEAIVPASHSFAMQDQGGFYTLTLDREASFDRAHMLRRIFVSHLIRWMGEPTA